MILRGKADHLIIRSNHRRLLQPFGVPSYCSSTASYFPLFFHTLLYWLPLAATQPPVGNLMGKHKTLQSGWYNTLGAECCPSFFPSPPILPPIRSFPETKALATLDSAAPSASPPTHPHPTTRCISASISLRVLVIAANILFLVRHALDPTNDERTSTPIVRHGQKTRLYSFSCQPIFGVYSAPI